MSNHPLGWCIAGILAALYLASAINPSGLVRQLSEHQPAKHAETDRTAGDTQSHAGQATAEVGAIQEPWNSKEARTKREQAADQRNKEDLIAQKSMADSTERMVLIGWLQMALGTLGLLAIGMTLWYTREAVEQTAKATKATEAAVKVTRKTAERELRAYVGIANASIVATEVGKTPNVKLEIKNFGSTPAKDVRHRYRTAVFALDEIEYDLSEAPLEHLVDLAPGQSLHPVKIINQLEWAVTRFQLNTGQRQLFVFGDIRYFDTMTETEERHTVYRYFLYVDSDGVRDDELSIVPGGNTMT